MGTNSVFGNVDKVMGIEIVRNGIPLETTRLEAPKTSKTRAHRKWFHLEMKSGSFVSGLKHVMFRPGIVFSSGSKGQNILFHRVPSKLCRTSTWGSTLKQCFPSPDAMTNDFRINDAMAPDVPETSFRDFPPSVPAKE